MHNLLRLFYTEIRRLIDYKVLYFGLFVSFLWVALLAVTSKAEATALLPQLLVLDAGLMTIILIGSSYYFEKQEGTLKAIFVSPVRPRHIVFSKIFASLLPSFISVTLITLIMGIIHNVWVPYGFAVIIIVLATIAHLSLGFILMFTSPDFMSLLVKYMGVALMLYLPTILVPLNLLSESIEWLAYLSPSYAAQYLIQHLFSPQENVNVFFSLSVLILIPSLLFPLYVYPQFKKETMKA